MNVDAILISEYATLTDNNRSLTVVRTFNALAVTTLPSQIPMMAVSFVVHAHWDERGTDHEFELLLINQRREEVGKTEGRFTLPPGGAEPKGIPLKHSHIARFANVPIQETGPYAFELYIDGTYNAAASFYVELAHGQR